MKSDMFDVVNYDKLGELLKKWANDEASRPAPGDIKVLETAMNNAGVEVSFAGRNYTKFEFLDTTKPGGDVLKLILPPKEIIQQSQDDIHKTHSYQLPDFYPDTFPGLPPVPDDKLDTFHMQRIGEYVMKWCG